MHIVKVGILLLKITLNLCWIRDTTTLKKSTTAIKCSSKETHYTAVSISTSDGIKCLNKDDVESFVYLLVNIYKGSLPWTSIPADESNYYEIYKCKRDVDPAELWRGMPKAIKIIFEYIRTLDNYDPINYDMIENSLIEAAKDLKIRLEVRWTQ